MIDPGHPFTVPFADLIASLEDRVRHGVERPEAYLFIFQDGVTSYPLPDQLYVLTRVSGLVGSRPQTFEQGRHYEFSANRLLWISETERPDSGRRVEVEYMVRELPPGITDFNQGSVAGTLVRAFARELAQMYAQMDEAYRRAFIDQATGAALDNVVALVGVTRNPAQPAIGEVTFFRKAPSPEPILIPKGARVSDATGRIFVTQREGTIPAPTAIDELAAVSGGVVKTMRAIEELRGVWPSAANPDTAPPMPVRPTFGSDAQTITFAPPAGAPPPSGEVRIRYLPRAATVPIAALEPGPEGNVNAGTITVMPTPPRGVDGVTNERPTSEGQAAESNERLRDRAKHALERAGNATVNAIKFAVLDVDGVEGCEVIDQNADDSIPLGEVRVRYSGGKVEEVRRAVETTRAAGIIARLEQIQTVLLSGTFFLVPAGPAPPPSAPATFLARAIEFLGELPIGAALALRRVNALAFDVTGLAEVAEAQLDFRRADGTTGPVADPFLIANTEILRPDNANLRAVLLAALHLSGSMPGAGANRLLLSVQVRDAAGAAVLFRRLSLSVNVAIRAYSLTASDQAPERIGNVTKTAEFTNSATAQLAITAADLAGFRPADHNPELEFVLSSTPWPGVQEFTGKATFPP